MMITGSASVYGIFGHPVEHTFSPGMHNAAFARLGMTACYVPFSVAPDRLENAVRAVTAMGLKGLNITVPHKENVIPFLDELAEDARLIGAVNTIQVRGDRLIGHNTDGRGFLRSLREGTSFRPKGKSVLVIGAGGAARAVSFILALNGVREILLSDTDLHKAERLAADIRSRTPASATYVGPGDLCSAGAAAQCIINATPLGLRTQDPLPLSRDCLRRDHLVCDLVYNPPRTKLLQTARSRGASTLSGIGMLLYQGVIAFEIWTGKKAPVITMKNALIKQMPRSGK